MRVSCGVLPVYRFGKEIALNFQQIVEIASVLVFFAGFYGLITSRNAIKSVAAIGIMEIAAVMFFLSLGYFAGIRPPIGSDMSRAADPLPQALVITAIVIGIAITTINLTMLITLVRQFKTLDWDMIKKKSME